MLLPPSKTGGTWTIAINFSTNIASDCDTNVYASFINILWGGPSSPNLYRGHKTVCIAVSVHHHRNKRNSSFWSTFVFVIIVDLLSETYCQPLTAEKSSSCAEIWTQWPTNPNIRDFSRYPLTHSLESCRTGLICVDRIGGKKSKMVRCRTAAWIPLHLFPSTTGSAVVVALISKTNTFKTCPLCSIITYKLRFKQHNKYSDHTVN